MRGYVMSPAYYNGKLLANENRDVRNYSRPANKQDGILGDSIFRDVLLNQISSSICTI
jgi:hypothetical protein